MSLCSSGEDLVLMASVAAVSLSKELSKDELVLLADFLGTLASNLALIAVQREIQVKEKTVIPLTPK